MNLSEITNEDIVKLYEEILNHIKYLESNILDEQDAVATTSDNSE